MRRAAAAADRNREVRRAAEAWSRAGVVTASTLKAIKDHYPDDRVRLHVALRILVFVFSSIGILGFAGLVWLGTDGEGFGVVAVALGLTLAVLTEVETGLLRWAATGCETATGLLAIAFLLGGTAWLIDRAGERVDATHLLFFAVLFCVAAAFRFAMLSAAVFASTSWFGWLTQLPHPRLTWALAGATLGVALLIGGSSARLPPALRRACLWCGAIAWLAVYASVNVYSFDQGLIEGSGLILDVGLAPAPQSLRVASIFATAVLPLALLVAGLLLRHRLLIDVGSLLLAASLVTLRFYVHVAPLWVVLTVAGALTIALAVRRWLESGALRERFGFTAEPIFEDPSRAGVLEIGATIATLSPAARPAPEAGRFEGGGGRSGGGGATEGF